ncbi:MULTISPECIES: sulfotransferase domain-containing protein [unclassified Mesorhizobium]|uniref:sulfotransferase domain-containing protein n=2 Tax=unclassified Mesorhizobium TaxID=325217 RepID=UPI001AEDB36C|nr:MULTISPECIES: sulfotransferase domain-containing protein [unclassified Mesorhizobium]
METTHKAIKLSSPGVQRTLIVVGCGRGGTSLVAGAASILGIAMGVSSDSTNHEDDELVNLAQGRDLDGNVIESPAETYLEKLRNLIQTRNEANDFWGWKDPSADMYLEAISDVLRDPLVLFVNRDMVAIAQSEVKRLQCSIEQAYDNALARYSRYWELLQRLQWPTLLVSYERAALDPAALLSEIAEFVGLEPPVERQSDLVKKFASSRDYRKIDLSEL